MSETPPETGPTTAELAERQDKLDGKLDQILSVIGGKKDAPADPGKADPPSTVAEEIRAQLEERDRKAAADKQAADHDSWRKSVDERLAGMAEKPPGEPAPIGFKGAVQRAMWGRQE
jgi:hypothetical protein